MARLCNGTTDGFSRGGYNLGIADVLSLAFWLNPTAPYLAVQNRAIAHGLNADVSVFSLEVDGQAVGAGANTCAVYFTQATPLYWLDSFPRPTVGVWHHFAWVMQRAVPLNTVYVDGVLQTLTPVLHQAAAYGNFSTQTLYVMNRAGANFVPGAIAELGVWGNDYAFTAADVEQLAAGASPAEVVPEHLIDYWPFFGVDSPEPDVTLGRAQPLALTGAPTAAAPPPVRSLLAQVA